MPPPSDPPSPVKDKPSRRKPKPTAPFKPRQLKVGYHYLSESGEPVPFLRMSGHWLAHAGFEADTNIRVTVESQRLVIEVAPPECIETPCVKYSRKRFMEVPPGDTPTEP